MISYSRLRKKTLKGFLGSRTPRKNSKVAKGQAGKKVLSVVRRLNVLSSIRGRWICLYRCQNQGGREKCVASYLSFIGESTVQISLSYMRTIFFLLKKFYSFLVLLEVIIRCFIISSDYGNIFSVFCRNNYWGFKMRFPGRDTQLRLPFLLTNLYSDFSQLIISLFFCSSFVSPSCPLSFLKQPSTRNEKLKRLLQEILSECQRKSQDRNEWFLNCLLSINLLNFRF